MSPASGPVLAFDVGGTHLRAALVHDGRLGPSVRAATPRGSGPALVAALEATARELLDGAEEPPVAVGLALAGLLDRGSGRLLRAPNLDLWDADLGRPLQDALGLPVRLVNDVNAAALGEARVAGCDETAVVFVGTGVGTGFVSGGRLLEGLRGMAAELGHVPLDPSGPDCPAGCRGCFDALLGGEGLARAAREAGLATDTAGLLAAWRAGDPGAGALVERALEAAAALGRLLVLIADPALIVVGGGLAKHLPELRDAVARGALDQPLAAGRTDLMVRAARCGDAAGLLGAAHLAAGG